MLSVLTMCRLNTQAHLGDLDGLAKNEPMVDGVKYEPTKVSFSVFSQSIYSSHRIITHPRYNTTAVEGSVLKALLGVGENPAGYWSYFESS